MYDHTPDPLSAGGLVAVVAWLGGVLAADHYLECNDQPSTLCLTRGYSTFELPLRNTANLIKIGESNLREDFTIIYRRLLLVRLVTQFHVYYM